MAELLKAINFAADSHRNQRRKNAEQTPYINHPIGVAYILAEIGQVTDLDTLIGAILHDTVEDTDATLDEIEEQFSAKIRQIVADVSDDKSLPKAERKKLQIEHAPHACPEAQLVKLGDKIHNLESLLEDPPRFWNVVQIQGYFVWAKQVCDQVRGVNSSLDAKLDQIYGGTFPYQDERYPCMPNEDHAEFLEKYYASM
jgi:hypothetical protein